MAEFTRRRITRATDPLFAAFLELYARSFPSWEQRSPEQQRLLLAEPSYFLEADESPGGGLAGFLCWWDLSPFTYIEHLAVAPGLRGSGRGAAMLENFLGAERGVVVLEIDPLTDEIAQRRLRFYASAGFLLNRHRHVHPGYKPGDQAHELLVLSHPRTISDTEFRTFRSLLSRTWQGDF